MADAMLERALALHARGFSVIPVPYPRPGVPKNTPGDGKTPIVKWGEFQWRHPTVEELRAWFDGARVNLAIMTGGISNLVVVDADSREGLRWCARHLKYTPWQVRTARGFHLYYRHPGVTVRNRATLDTGAGKIAVDVRGDGGYVIGPGSVHASGHVYEWAGDWTREDVPRFWPGWLQRAELPTRPLPVYSSRWRPSGDAADRARRYLAKVPKPEIGQGSDAATLYAACRLVRGFNLSEADAESLLWEWAGNRPGWTREWVAQKVQHALRYGTEPIGGLA